MPLHLLAQSVEYTRFGIFHILNLDQNFLLFFYYYYGTQTTVDAIICVLTMSNLFLFDTLTLCAKSWVHCFYSLPFKFNSCRSLGLWQSHRPVSYHTVLGCLIGFPRSFRPLPSTTMKKTCNMHRTFKFVQV
jgi:hypothetical protein